VTGLTLGAWVSFNDAVLKEALPATAAYGAEGDRLPFSSKFTANVSVEEAFPLTGRVSALVGGAVSYVGDRTGNSLCRRRRLPRDRIFRPTRKLTCMQVPSSRLGQ